MAFNYAVLAVYGNSREVADVLVSSGQLVEQSCLSAVLVADKRKGELSAVGQGIAAALCVEPSALAKSRVSGFFMLLFTPTFSKRTTKNYLDERAPELRFTSEGFERFYKCTSGIPYYINIFARQLPVNQELDENKVIEAFDNNISLIISHLINEWNRLTTKEKDIIIALIDLPLKRIDLARKLHVKSGSLSDKLNKLQNLGSIHYVNGEYEISEKLIKRWLEIEYSQKGIYPYRF